MGDDDDHDDDHDVDYDDNTVGLIRPLETPSGPGETLRCNPRRGVGARPIMDVYQQGMRWCRRSFTHTWVPKDGVVDTEVVVEAVRYSRDKNAIAMLNCPFQAQGLRLIDTTGQAFCWRRFYFAFATK